MKTGKSRAFLLPPGGPEQPLEQRLRQTRHVLGQSDDEQTQSGLAREERVLGFLALQSEERDRKAILSLLGQVELAQQRFAVLHNGEAVVLEA